MPKLIDTDKYRLGLLKAFLAVEAMRLTILAARMKAKASG